MKKDYEKKYQLQSDASVAKERLMKIEDELRENGFIREANSLSTIIWKIEEWQNK